MSRMRQIDLPGVPAESVLARHIAVLGPGGVEDRTSEVAKGWIGTTEAYNLNEHRGKTTLRVSIKTSPEWRGMFDEGWPGALEELRKLSERQLATV
jgi:hypothetical protein